MINTCRATSGVSLSRNKQNAVRFGSIQDYLGLVCDYSGLFRDYSGLFLDYSEVFRDYSGLFRNYLGLFGTMSLLFCIIWDYLEGALMNLGFHNHV